MVGSMAVTIIPTLLALIVTLQSVCGENNYVLPEATEVGGPLRCPGDDWEVYDGRCYFLFNDSRTNFDDANNKCKKYGSLPVSIHSNDENMFILSRAHEVTGGLSASLWLGLIKDRRIGEFKWSDGSVYNYSNWAYGEPNDSRGAESCVEMHADTGNTFLSGEWNDIPCSLSNDFVMCKAPTVRQEFGAKFTIIGDFATRDNSPISEKCKETFNEDYHNKLVEMIAQVNELLENKTVCEATWLTIVQLKSSSMSTNNNEGNTVTTLNIFPSMSSNFSRIQECSEIVSNHTRDYRNWNQPIIEEHPGCPDVGFKGNGFKDGGGAWICTDSGGSNGLTRLPHFLVAISGNFSTEGNVDISDECHLAYTEGLQQRSNGMTATVNREVQAGKLCAQSKQWATVFNSNTAVTSSGSQARANIDFHLSAPQETSTIIEVESCGFQISEYLQLHSNWERPIIDGIPCCPATYFSSERFDDNGRKWSCPE